MIVPEGYAVVNPYLVAAGADGYIRFLIAAFGAVEEGRSVTPTGRLANSQINIGGARLMLSEATPDYQPTASAFMIYVENADAAVKRAVDAGAEQIMDVADMPYDDRQGGVRDPQGNIWWISQRLVNAPYQWPSQPE